MDIEQLKMILETANTAGEGVKTIAFLYLAKEATTSLLGFGVLGLLIWLTYKAVLRLTFGLAADTQTLKKIGELLKESERLDIVCYPPFASGERKRIVKAVQDLLKENKRRDE